VIVSLHVATGAAAGALSRSRLHAFVLGPLLHVAGDRLPHEDIPNRRFEVASGLFGVAVLAARRGAFSPVTIGALAASAPDLEHIFPALRPLGRKFFHDRGWHRRGPFSASAQLVIAGAILGLLVAPKGSHDSGR
jgi:hypothetical protein